MLLLFWQIWGTYDEAIQYSYLLMCNQIVEKIPKIPDYILEQGFLVEADENEEGVCS